MRFLAASVKIAFNEESFHREIQEGDDPRLNSLIYADWLEEQGDPRTGFVRAVHDEANVPSDRLLGMLGVPSLGENLKGSWVNQYVADVAESVLSTFETRFPEDSRPRAAIELAREGGDSLRASDEAFDAARHASLFRASKAAWAANAAGHAAYIVSGTPFAQGLFVGSRNASDSPERQERWNIARMGEYMLFDGKKVVTPGL